MMKKKESLFVNIDLHILDVLHVDIKNFIHLPIHLVTHMYAYTHMRAHVYIHTHTLIQAGHRCRCTTFF